MCAASSTSRERLGAFLSLGSGVWLLITHDHHGAAVMIGGLIAVALIYFKAVESD
jgi:hypothetical protein